MPEALAKPGWAVDRWWEAAEYAGELPYTPERVRASFDTLERHFRDDWWEDRHERPRNVVVRNLRMKGLQPLGFLVYLGIVLERIERAIGFDRKLKALKRDLDDNVLLECELASALADEGWVVSFPREGHVKTPDVLVERAGERAAIECKRLDGEAWEAWEEDLTTKMLFTPPIGGHEDSYRFQVQLQPRVTDLRLNPDDYEDINAAMCEGIVGRVQAALLEAVASSPEEATAVSMPGIGMARVLPQPCQEHSWVTSGGVSPAAKVRRLFTNGVLPACKQLPPDLPGIVVVCAEHLGDPALARLMLDAFTKTRPDHFGHLAAVFLVPVKLFGGSIFSKTLLLNRHARVDAGRLAAVGVLREALHPAEA